ncbi:MAG: hypothetical protein ACYCUM_00955 [Solirubrobacteraceae bacterium]
MLAVLDLDHIEFAAGAADEVDLTASSGLPDVQALWEGECLDQPAQKMLPLSQAHRQEHRHRCR